MSGNVKLVYTYCAIRYVHDAGAGEQLNVGVVLYSADAAFLGYRLESRYERLSKTFANFDGDRYKLTLRRFESALGHEKARLEDSLPGISEGPRNVLQIISGIWPDQGLAFQASSLMAGVAENLDVALQSAFAALVRSQSCLEMQTQRRGHHEVWSTFQSKLSDVGLTPYLRSVELTQDGMPFNFEHSVKNGKYHILKPLSLDYQQKSYLQDKVSQSLGEVLSIAEHPEVGGYYMLLGRPQNDVHQETYESARRLLEHKMPDMGTLVDEEDADEFAKKFAQDMHDHGLELS